MGNGGIQSGAASTYALAEKIENLYESFLQSGDLQSFYDCLTLACSNDTVSKTAIELIKSHYKEDSDGNPPIIASNRHQSLFIEQKLQYDIWRKHGHSEGKIWRMFADLYGIEVDSVKRQFKRKLSEQQKGQQS